MEKLKIEVGGNETREVVVVVLLVKVEKLEPVVRDDCKSVSTEGIE